MKNAGIASQITATGTRTHVGCGKNSAMSSGNNATASAIAPQTSAIFATDALALCRASEPQRLRLKRSALPTTRAPTRAADARRIARASGSPRSAQTCRRHRAGRRRCALRIVGRARVENTRHDQQQDAEHASPRRASRHAGCSPIRRTAASSCPSSRSIAAPLPSGSTG